MKYRISSKKTLTRSQIRRVIIKWMLYSLCLILFYMLMRSGTFTNWQPFLIIPLAISVSMHERELSSCVFALFCGYFIDIACRFIFGFSAIWLMIVCITTALLSRNLIRVNILNFLWICTVATLLEFSMDYLFNVFLWNIPGGEAVFSLSTLPSAIATIVCSPFVYLVIRIINIKCGDYNKFSYYSPDSSVEDDELKTKD